jgi:hypothetical protein
MVRPTCYLFIGVLAAAVACSSSGPAKPSAAAGDAPAPTVPDPRLPAPAAAAPPAAGPAPTDRDAAPHSNLAHAADPEPHAAEAAADRAAQAAASNRPLENIQVLPRSWPRERVLTYMKNVVSAGLGVRCTFCHEGKDFAKDTEHKREARAMIRLTQEVNRKFFAGKARVSCMTCHQGHKEPQAGL